MIVFHASAVEVDVHKVGLLRPLFGGLELAVAVAVLARRLVGGQKLAQELRLNVGKRDPGG
ncbi:hypothetical protein G3545_02575 [Starkeya sp. ORNL1]|uniref:hypothetical protein n=1 Tax=Starkeya sp. ORNL1 TaxID=2709380 RepID=UPI00146375D2|nr:hypothetical protein [Starkeya sp. ORNL1]QJP12645.1 hypothetical protein G3545_02575 [Starkeya sp. ORNL1]